MLAQYRPAILMGQRINSISKLSIKHSVTAASIKKVVASIAKHTKPQA